jgi:2-acylglycerol O-acyltransferase 2
MWPRHPASETAGQRAQAHDVDDRPLNADEKTPADATATDKKRSSDAINKQDVIR